MNKKAHQILLSRGRHRTSQSGSVFFVIFGVLAMLMVVSMVASDFIRGPLKTATTVNRQNVVETQLQMAAKIAAQAAVNQAGAGDCDADTFIEPVPFKDAAGAPAPVGGGLIPDTMASPKRDPWNTDYGYCVWDHGADIDDAACGGASQLRLSGTNVPIWSTLAIISAGPDKVFQTTCNDWVDANANNQPDTPLVNKPTGSDDIILDWTYTQASAAATVPPIAGGNLWIEETPGGKIRYDADNVGIGVSDPPARLSVQGEIKLASTGASCTADLRGSLRWNNTLTRMEMCDGTTWLAIANSQTTAAPPTAPVNQGYFVLTQSAWNGNLGDLAGANALCLNELTTNTNWRGYGSALAAGQLTSSNVSAWLCASSCNNLMPLTTYNFARVGDSSAGGASFTTNALSQGPFDPTLWNSANRFSGTFTYWTNRGSTGCGAENFTNTGGTACDGNWVNCNPGFSNSSSGSNGAIGNSSSSGVGRFAAAVQACNTTHRLICMVNPASGGGCGGNGTILPSSNTSLLQSVQVPAGCRITFKAWGGGGGAGGASAGSPGGHGGGAGYATVTLTPSATTTYYVTTGAGGNGGNGTNTNAHPGNGGSGATGFSGGSGGFGNTAGGGGGAGGGAATTICLNNYCGSGGVHVLIAGGGGGGAAPSAAGLPGGQTTGGLATSSTGGVGGTNFNGGGGGGGGGCNNSACSDGGGQGAAAMAGGNGGRSYVETTLANHTVAGIATTGGTGQTPGNNADPNRPMYFGSTAGSGRAAPGSGGNNGLHGIPGGVYWVIF